MEFINQIVENWHIVVSIVILLAVVVYAFRFFKLTPAQQKRRIKTALLAIVKEMEEQYGPKTGAIKRSQAYNSLVKLFPILTVFLSQETFDKMLDEALESLEESLTASLQESDDVEK